MALGGGSDLLAPKLDAAQPAAEADRQRATLGAASSKSQRSCVDEDAPMGNATTRLLDRVAASLGKLDEAAPCFVNADDVPSGGLLIALPALLSIGLLRHTREHFKLPAGFYGIESIFLILAFMALARVRSLDALRYETPGEWGKLLGLDRIPEVRTLRNKLGILCQAPEATTAWSSQLSADWMGGDPLAAGTLLIDGHTRVYHGRLTKLPRRYISRDRLCLRATTDYWVNALNGDPFFVVTKTVDSGLIATLRDDIVPRLEKEIPRQPTREQLDADAFLHRFTLIFDREAYSPDFFAEMRAKRIAIISYHKHPGDDWRTSEFEPIMVRLQNGEEILHKLAERGTCLRNGFWVREVRHLDDKGHQCSILTTDFKQPMHQVAAAMFARWSQENFFKYMRQHYGLDALVEYGTMPLPETTPVVNPAWRALDSKIRSHNSKLVYLKAQFGALLLPSAASPEDVTKYESKKGRLLEDIEKRTKQVIELKTERKNTAHKLAIKDLPSEHRFEALSSVRKHFVDTIKLIAYRAESALVHLAREKLAREDDARSFIRNLFKTTVDLRPTPSEKTLTIRFHTLPTASHNQVLAHLCEELTETETVFPSTGLRMIFSQVGSA